MVQDPLRSTLDKFMELAFTEPVWRSQADEQWLKFALPLVEKITLEDPALEMLKDQAVANVVEDRRQAERRKAVQQ